MNDITAQIEALLKDEALRGALTTEAYRKVVAMHDVAKEADKKAAQADDEAKSLRLKIIELEQKVNASRLIEEGLAKRESDLVLREKNITTLELTAKHQIDRVNDHKEMVRLVFRNIDLVRTQIGNVPCINKMQDGSQYTSTVPTTITETETKA